MRATRLTIEGVDPDEITTGFLTGIVAAAEAEELAIHGVSIERQESGEGDKSDGE